MQPSQSIFLKDSWILKTAKEKSQKKKVINKKWKLKMIIRKVALNLCSFQMRKKKNLMDDILLMIYKSVIIVIKLVIRNIIVHNYQYVHIVWALIHEETVSK